MGKLSLLNQCEAAAAHVTEGGQGEGASGAGQADVVHAVPRHARFQQVKAGEAAWVHR